VRDSFWDTTTTGVSVSDGGAGRTTAQMQDRSTYVNAGWDFAGQTADGTADIWQMSDSEPNYPRLAWESPVDSP